MYERAFLVLVEVNVSINPSKFNLLANSDYKHKAARGVS